MDLEDMVREFAGKEDQVVAVFRGVGAEKDFGIVYYLLTPNQGYDRDFEDRVSDLDIDIYKKTGQGDYAIFSWPISVMEAEETPYMGECIFRKE